MSMHEDLAVRRVMEISMVVVIEPDFDATTGRQPSPWMGVFW